MRKIELTEFRCTTGVPLTGAERDALRRSVPEMLIQPSPMSESCFDLTPSAQVGSVRVGDTLIEIRPKIAIDRFMFLLSYAADPKAWTGLDFEYAKADSIVEAIVPAFLRLVGQATNRGLLHGYRVEETAGATVRGQLRINDQLRDRFGLAPPIEIRYEEFTEDVLENRMIRAALHRLRQLRIRSEHTQRALREVEAAFHAVELLEFHPRHIPEVQFTRLNEHYRPAIGLARLILQSISFELSFGPVQASCFLLDMNELFEAFVHRALRETLNLPEAEFPRGAGGLRLDQAGRIALVPDLSWWTRGRCTFVGDVKYKRVSAAGVKHPDLYQLLAYVTATDLAAGLLIYAAGEAEPTRHHVEKAGKTLMVTALDVSGPPASILAQVSRLAELIRQMRSFNQPQPGTLQPAG